MAEIKKFNQGLRLDLWIGLTYGLVFVIDSVTGLVFSCIIFSLERGTSYLCGSMSFDFVGLSIPYLLLVVYLLQFTGH